MKRPEFSVVVPTYNRPERLAACVGALARLEYPRDRFEVIVVDDGSEEPAEPHAVRASGDLRLMVVRQQNAGPAAARNRGAEAAAGEYLAFTDDDCAPARDWLDRLAARVNACPRALVGGRLVNALPRDLCAAASQEITDFACRWAETRGAGIGPGRTWLFATANLACSRDLFRRVGGFDRSFPLAAGEDYDFCHRYQHAGHPAVWAPEAVVYHAHAMTARGFWRQHTAYGRGLLLFRRRASARLGREAERNLGGFQCRLAWHCLRAVRGPRSAAIAVLVGVSQVATIAGAIAEMRRIGDGGGDDRGGSDETPVRLSGEDGACAS